MRVCEAHIHDPGVLEGLFDGESLGRVHHHQAADQVLRLGGGGAPEGRVEGDAGGEDLLGEGVSVEGELAREDDVEKDAE